MMNTEIFSKKDLTDENFERLIGYLKKSEVIAFPTETVYGLGAHVFREKAIEKIYELKKRDKKKALIVHLGSIESADKIAHQIPDDFYVLAQRFFPGPLTIILKKKPDILSLISSDETIALRMPDNIYTLRLINLLNSPIVGTSANISNQKNPINVKDVSSSFLNKIKAIIDTGTCKIKIPSTIISLVEKPYKIIRQGAISEEKINEVLKISF